LGSDIQASRGAIIVSPGFRLGVGKMLLFPGKDAPSGASLHFSNHYKKISSKKPNQQQLFQKISIMQPENDL